MMIGAKRLSALREQYPVGSRIRLTEMKDPYHPVEPGTMGTLVHIDDAGTFHMKWDNGRSLGLVFGEDSFSILPPGPALLKLYMPMTVDHYEQNEYGDMDDEPYELSSYDAARYADHINAALQKEHLTEKRTGSIRRCNPMFSRQKSETASYGAWLNAWLQASSHRRNWPCSKKTSSARHRMALERALSSGASRPRWI